MKTIETRSLVSQFRRAGPPALLAACLAIGPAFAQSSTTVVTPDSSTETTKTKIKEKSNGDTVVKQKSTSDDSDVTVKSKTKTTVEEPDASTTVKVR